MNNKPQRSKFLSTICVFQWVFAAIGFLFAFGTFIQGGFLNFIASVIACLSALMIAPIFEMIQPLKKYSMISLIPRAVISFILVVAAVSISPDSDSTSNIETSSNLVTTTSTTDATTTTNVTTAETTAITTTPPTTTTIKTTATATTTFTTTTVATTVTTEPPPEVPTEPPTPAPTEKPYVPPIQSNEHDYVLNTSTMKAHTPGCRDIDKIDDENRCDYYGTVDELISMGYSSCGHCNAW